MPQGNVSIDYAEIDKVAKTMNDAVTNIVPMLQSTKTTVEGLLDNGLFMQQSSPAMKASYEKLTLSLSEAMKGITAFAGQFQKIKTAVAQMDADIAKGTNG
ncbi:hypothetical protein GO001_00540 [Streptomyces sp. NRRL B-1677]|uniref:WXG100 family type VII secretion target n=2 Tax=Streptomyces TaxID=1883 RepID=A0A3B0AX48_9ACTN|nr:MULTISPECIES: hypothetical protein [Streptomyces]MBF6043707.1 hypothetical protein [Streptomyces sp. NRRL B-1677]MCQ8769398.1 hypothetical protein [Streptomyces telluris]NJP77778.1 hypothetical protein [Streptomyces telluris]RKN64407.1 hypothetical protein D7231_28840 [Streptomyces klenkii]